MVVVLVLLASLAAAQDDSWLDEGVKLKNQALSVIMVTSILVTALMILAIISKQKFRNHKKMLFLLMIIPIIVATLYAAGTTIYLNKMSESGGPVHWHADFEIWNCGEKVDLLDPSGLSNRFGTPVFHEHNDFRIHVEGVVIKTADVSLENFFNVIGGVLTQESLGIPTDDGLIYLKDGDLCKGKPGKVQVFAYKTINPEEHGKWIYTQRKVENYAYYIAPYAHVPPGDCIIIEFDQEKEQTDKICTTYQAAINRGELHGR